jgi:UDP-N-acetylmuramyl pentapeptide synthase
VAREKADLARALPADGTAVLPGDDARLLAECAGIAAKVVTFGQQETDLVRIEEATEGDRASGVLACRGERLAVRLPVCGTVNLRNAAAALCVACVLGLPVREAAAALARFVPDRMRMDMRTVAGATVLLDAYNANPESMLAALRTLAGLPGGRRIAVLGRMLELGADAPRLHEEVGAAAARLGVEVVVALMDDTGGYAAGAGRGGCPRVVSAGSHREAAEVLAAELKAGDLVLLKGSRGARVECVLDSLAEVTAP